MDEAAIDGPPKLRSGDRAGSGRDLHELDLITTTVPVEHEGRLIPRGSSGLILEVSRAGGYFEVEFLAPFHCVVTMHASAIVAAG